MKLSNGDCTTMIRVWVPCWVRKYSHYFSAHFIYLYVKKHMLIHSNFQDFNLLYDPLKFMTLSSCNWEIQCHEPISIQFSFRSSNRSIFWKYNFAVKIFFFLLLLLLWRRIRYFQTVSNWLSSAYYTTEPGKSLR